MLKIMDGNLRNLKQGNIAAKYILSDNVALDGAELIPIDLGGRLAPHTVSLNELGKQLLRAAADGNVEEIRVLMTKGATFTADWLGTSPLHLAAQNNHLEVCEILLRAGICRDARTKVDRTPLHMAAYEGHIDIVECLLKNGADHDCRDLLGMTPLHWAAQNGHAEVASMLIRYGASTNVTNKFDLTPSDIAMQIKRPDIVETISMEIRDPLLATRKLALEMISNDNSRESQLEQILEPESADVPIGTFLYKKPTKSYLETILLEDDSENSVDPEKIQLNQGASIESEPIIQDESFTESMKLLQQHGITMLPTDESSILSSVMENGHSVVLTDIGKEVLNSIKTVEPPVETPQPVKVQQIQMTPKKKKIITITPDEFLAMTNSGALSNVNSNVIRQINSKIIATKPTLKRIVMKKNKVVPISPSINIQKSAPKVEQVDLETLLKQLSDAHKLIEEYKTKLMKKEAEVEKYKQQLRLLMPNK